MKNRIGWALLLSLILSLTLVSAAWAESELEGGKYYTIVNEKGSAIDYTGLKVSVGDEYISPNNTHYRVVKVVGLKAYARNLGKVQLVTGTSNYNYAGLASIYGYQGMIAANRQVVGVYATHTDESYVPTDGKESIRGKGGIKKVANTLAKGLSGQGLKAIYDPASHDPHDANAYNRSRKTASRLMRQGAFSLIDVHRDAAPAKAYAANVQGKNVTRIKLVVGRSNPKMAANMDFAKRMKAHIDKEHPGLSAGIFIGRGNYNQDLTPRSMLIEVGAHKNDRAAAQQAVSLFSSSVPEVLGVKASNTSKTSSQTSKTGSNNDVKGTLTATDASRREQKTNYGTTIGIVIALAVAGGAFFMLNKGKVK